MFSSSYISASEVQLILAGLRSLKREVMSKGVLATRQQHPELVATSEVFLSSRSIECLIGRVELAASGVTDESPSGEQGSRVLGEGDYVMGEGSLWLSYEGVALHVFERGGFLNVEASVEGDEDHSTLDTLCVDLEAASVAA